MRDGQPRYLYFQRGGLTTAPEHEEAPEGFELAQAESLPRNMDCETLIQYVADGCRRLACLPL
jgi:hypothetical protein